MKVVIRADASTELGSGHVARCLGLADGLVEAGGYVTFLCRILPGDQTAFIESKGYRVYRLRAGGAAPSGQEQDAEECAALLGSMGRIDWLVVDHYGLALPWEKAVRRYAGNLLVIDDLGNRRHACDLLLDPNLYDVAEARYRGLADHDTHLLIGPRYALLRREFRARPALPRTGSVRRLLVFFGGADQPNETSKALRAIKLLGRDDIAVDVVVGPMNPHAPEIEEISRELAQCRVLRNADMALAMRDADLAIGAGGTTAWERCTQGLPALAWPIADNQEVVVTGLAKRGAVYRPAMGSIADAEGVAKHLYALINSPALIALMSERALTICDGRGVSRVVSEMRGHAIVVQIATADDARKIYEWRNHPHVRAMSVHTAPIEWETHERWFRRALVSEDRRILIGYEAGRAIGVVRFDIVETGVAEVSIYTDPDLVDRGYGGKLLRAGEAWFIAHYPQIRRLIAKVRPDNLPSQRLFQRGGYTSAFTIYQKERTQ